MRENILFRIKQLLEDDIERELALLAKHLIRGSTPEELSRIYRLPESHIEGYARTIRAAIKPNDKDKWVQKLESFASGNRGKHIHVNQLLSAMRNSTTNPIRLD